MVLIHERFFENKITQFTDLCSVSNVSLLNVDDSDTALTIEAGFLNSGERADSAQSSVWILHPRPISSWPRRHQHERDE